MADINPDDLSRIVMLTYGTMDHGGPYWCFVAVKPSKYDAFQAAMSSKKYDMQRFSTDGFGEVVVSGEGTTPPSEVVGQVAKMFNVPISDLFKETDPKAKINMQIQALKDNLSS